jgi:hypothetical protein
MVLVSVGASGWRRFLLLGLIGLGGLVFSLIATEGQLQRFFDFGTDDYNLTNEGRWYFWRQGIVWMIKRPWGYGIGNYSTYFDWLNGHSRAAHSMWVQYGMELGVLGLTTIVGLCWYLWTRLGRIRRAALRTKQRPADAADHEAVLAGHVQAMLAGTLVTGSLLSNAYYPLTYMALGISAAVLLGTPFRAQLSLPKAASSQPAPPPPAGYRGVTRVRRRTR